jgi:hypothetical protein
VIAWNAGSDRYYSIASNLWSAELEPVPSVTNHGSTAGLFKFKATVHKSLEKVLI